MKSFMLMLFCGFGVAMAIQDPAKEAIEKSDNVVVLFVRSSCPYCQYLLPIMDKVFVPYRRNIQYIVVEISSMPDYYKKTYHFSTVPTALYYKNGKLQTSHGSNNKTITQHEVKDCVRRVYGL